MEVFCKPPGNPRGLFLEMPAACKASSGGHLALNFASERRTTPERAMPASSASRGSCSNGFGRGTNPAVGWIQQAVTSTLPVHPASD